MLLFTGSALPCSDLIIISIFKLVRFYVSEFGDFICGPFIIIKELLC